MDVQLQFVNRSDDRGETRVVIFAKNALAGIDEMPVAWLAIDGCPPGGARRFVYPAATAVEANDEAGHRTARLPAQPGQLFEMQPADAGHRLVQAGAAGDPRRIEVRHGLPEGVIGASLYKDGRLLATRQSISPKQKAVFLLQPVLWIAALPGIDEGRVIPPPVEASVTTQLSLQDVASADIVMTGGGDGPGAPPLRFALENVVRGPA